MVDAATLQPEEDLGWRGPSSIRSGSAALTLPDLSAQFLALPICRSIRRLQFALPGYSKHGPLDDWTATFAAVCAAPTAGGLQSLAFDFAWDETIPPLDTIEIGDFSRGWESLSSVRSLALRGRALRLGGATVASLTALTWEASVFGAKDCRELLDSRLPMLKELRLMGELGEAAAKLLIQAVDAFPVLVRFEAGTGGLSEKTRAALKLRFASAGNAKRNSVAKKAGTGKGRAEKTIATKRRS